MNSPFMISKAPLDIILLAANITVGESSFMNSPYMIYKAPFPSVVLSAHITILPHEQFHTLSKALNFCNPPCRHHSVQIIKYSIC